MIAFLGFAYIGLAVLLCYLIDKGDSGNEKDEAPKDWLEDRDPQVPLIYYRDGERPSFDLTFPPYCVNTLNQAIRYLCRKLEIHEIIVPPIRRAERFALYYSSKPVSQNIMCNEETLESFMGVRKIQYFEEGSWLIQYCPSGKTFFMDGKSIYGSSLEDVFETFNEYLKKKEGV